MASSTRELVAPRDRPHEADGRLSQVQRAAVPEHDGALVAHQRPRRGCLHRQRCLAGGHARVEEEHGEFVRETTVSCPQRTSWTCPATVASDGSERRVRDGKLQRPLILRAMMRTSAIA